MLMVAQATKTSVTTANHVEQLPSAVWRSQDTQIPAGQKHGRASLDWTAEGGCPHVVRGKPRLSQYFLSLPTPAGIILRLEDT